MRVLPIDQANAQADEIEKQILINLEKRNAVR